MIMKKIGLILLSISLFALGIFVINGFVPDATLENNSFEKLNIEYTPSPVITPGEIQNSSVTEPVELNFSGKILTCTNFTDVEQVIDIRLTNLEAKNKSISIYPINITLDLLSEQILRKDLFILPGTSALKLVSSDGEESLVQVPPCGSRVSSASDIAGTDMQTTTPAGTPIATQTTNPATSKVEEIPEFPTIALPIMTIIALLFIMKKTK
ncbi:MAG: PEF-CTERM sorting domain-containing protein [Candidatus Methanoperedens sp.]